MPPCLCNFVPQFLGPCLPRPNLQAAQVRQVARIRATAPQDPGIITAIVLSHFLSLFVIDSAEDVDDCGIA